MEEVTRYRVTVRATMTGGPDYRFVREVWAFSEKEAYDKALGSIIVWSKIEEIDPPSYMLDPQRDRESTTAERLGIERPQARRGPVDRREGVIERRIREMTDDIGRGTYRDVPGSVCEKHGHPKEV